MPSKRVDLVGDALWEHGGFLVHKHISQTTPPPYDTWLSTENIGSSMASLHSPSSPIARPYLPYLPRCGINPHVVVRVFGNPEILPHIVVPPSDNVPHEGRQEGGHEPLINR